jgi:hypothetical protein
MAEKLERIQELLVKLRNLDPVATNEVKNVLETSLREKYGYLGD